MKELLKTIAEKYPLIPHGSGCLYSSVRRMKAEKRAGIPIRWRIGWVISVETGKAANEMTKREWEKFYKDLRENLKRDYPDRYYGLFPAKK